MDPRLPREMGLPLCLVLALALAGCTEPATSAPDALPFLPGLAPSGWKPQEGVEWGNLTGAIEPGACVSVDAFAPPPVIQSWWLRATPNVTLAMANWTPGATSDSLCDRLDGGGNGTVVEMLRDVRASNASVEIPSGSEGHEFALWCEASAPCEVRWWLQHIRGQSHADGARRWPAGVGPAPDGFAA